jgi:nucleoside-diphosphate-sugar epimerase
VGSIIKSLTNKNARGQIINIGSGKPRIIKNVIKYIKKLSKGGNPLFGKIKLRKDEILKAYPDINKAKNKINWRPNISFKEGLRITIGSYKQ